MAIVAIDARKYFDYGIGSYIQNLVRSLSSIPSNHSFHLIVSPTNAEAIRVPEGWNVIPSERAPYSIGEFLLLGREALQGKVGLFHEPHYTLPLGLHRCSVVTVHDLIQIKMTQYFSPLQRSYARWMMGRAVRSAGAVIAVSQKTKDDIVEMFGVKEERVHVVYHGIQKIFRPLPGNARASEFRKQKGLDRPYVLYVGNVKPHKNIPALLDAFALVQKTHEDLTLAFAGGECLETEALRRRAERLGIVSAIHDLRRLTEEELVSAYNGAELLVLPSLYEGFGFPVLEAMACGTPVIAADAGSLPEIAGNAAILADPMKAESIAEGIRLILERSDVREKHIRLGFERVAGFTWERTAGETMKLYERVLSECRVP
jgi:glycosyltransferase involved in cell wall biosynthesis